MTIIVRLDGETHFPRPGRELQRLEEVPMAGVPDADPHGGHPVRSRAFLDDPSGGGGSDIPHPNNDDVNKRWIMDVRFLTH